MTSSFSTMTSRERVLAAIALQPVDRIPTDLWATPEVWDMLRARFGSTTEVCAALHIDGFAGLEPRYVGPPLPEVATGENVDFWGIRTTRVTYVGGAYQEQSFCPLAAAETIDDLARYPWPQVAWFDFSTLPEVARAARRTHAIQCGYMAPFYQHILLRGLEQALLDPLERPEFTHELLQRITAFLYAYHRRLFEVCEGLIDVAQVTDDLGSQHGPLISLETYRTFYAPHHRRLIALCHEFGIKVLHHNDGAIRPFLPLLVEMGIDILNPVQWTCPGMEMSALKRDFGGRLCFHGAVENQRILPFGTPEDVRAEVRHCIDALASDGTGYILASCHNLQPNTPLENIVAMYDEAYHYGKR
ncbi:MAG: uroporphyrinogen-III decarboxylase-like protein [bacterium]|nr:uroporphyrinogen-III decarboxylase-like protein [bacterium]